VVAACVFAAISAAVCFVGFALKTLVNINAGRQIGVCIPCLPSDETHREGREVRKTVRRIAAWAAGHASLWK
jgi:hypothetical protein